MRDLDVTLITVYKKGNEMLKKDYTVRARRKSLNRSEFYGAYAAGLNAQCILDIVPAEYYLADVVEEGKTYHATRCIVEGHERAIIRTYEKNHASMELTVG